MAESEIGANLKAFVSHVEQLKSTEDGFEKEYATLKERSTVYKLTLPFTAGSLPCNSKKNRYKDILPFDHARVLLPILGDAEGSDYINASKLQTRDGYHTPTRVIAAQGPLSATVLDFWRMLWVHKISVVVMVARVVEMGKKKCEKYWPDDGNAMRYGEVTVFNDEVDQTNAPDFVVRTMRMQCGSETRTLKHFQYLVWPDHGVPESPTSIMKMLREIRETVDVDQAPMVIHCSAGCGRTGTLAVIDDIWTSLEDGYLTLPIDIFAVADRFRKCRQAIIQTKEQYFYAYKAVLNLMEEIRKGTIPKSGSRRPSIDNSSKPTSPTKTEDATLYVNTKPGSSTGSEPLYVNLDKFVGADPTRARAFTAKLAVPEVNDVRFTTSTSLIEEEEPDEESETQNRDTKLSWQTAQRESSQTRTRIMDFDQPFDYGAHGNRIDMPIGARLPKNFSLSAGYFVPTYVSP